MDKEVDHIWVFSCFLNLNYYLWHFQKQGTKRHGCWNALAPGSHGPQQEVGRQWSLQEKEHPSLEESSTRLLSSHRGLPIKSGVRVDLGQP